MQLTLELPPNVVEDPTPEEIERLIRQETEFAILSDLPESLTYIQFPWGDDSSMLSLEYQDGSTERHFHATNADIDIEAVIKAFQRFSQNDPSWRSDFVWERMVV